MSVDAFASSLADLLDPPEDRTFELLGYEPNCLPRIEAARAMGFNFPSEVPDDERWLLPPPCGECPQERFHAATEFDVLYGGAAGGGKTKALLMEGLRACVRHPYLRVGAFRRSYPELEESLLAELAEVGYAQALGATWNASKHDLTFPNRSRLMFRYAETLPDATRRQGGQYQLLLFDERTLTPPAVVTFLCSRLRSGRADVPVLGVRSGTNPGGVGHGEVKKSYIEATEHGTKVVTDVRGRTVAFIPSKVSDNPHVNAEYATDLDALPEQMRAAFRDGDWDSFVGQVFTEWDRDRHLVPRFTVPADWHRYTGIDHGYAAPWAALTGARDGDGRLWLYREHYAAGVGEKAQAKAILDAEHGAGETLMVRAADPSMWAKKGSALPIASTYALEGCALVPADNDRINGWARVHTYLADGPACEHHRVLGWETCPMLHVLDDTCPNLVRTLPSAPYDKLKVEDVDTTYEDHALDALRYLVMAIGVAPALMFTPETAPVTALDGSELMRDAGGGVAFGKTATIFPRRGSTENGATAPSPFV